jgi:ECF sigma factor
VAVSKLPQDDPTPPAESACAGDAATASVTRWIGDLIASGGDDGRNPLDRVIGSEPSPEFAAVVAEEYRRRLDALWDPALRTTAGRKLACHTNEEIAREPSVSLRTVTLKLELTRKLWVAEAAT